jgi:hypothetical protein
MSGGKEIIRSALRSRNAKVNLSTFGKSLGLNADQIHGFIFDGTDLTREQLCAISEYLWAGHTVYNAELDVLQPARAFDPKPLGVLPQLDTTRLPKYVAGAVQHPGPQFANDSPPDVKPKTRPGWLGGFV